MHVLDDLPPSHPGVVRAEGNLALLRGVRNDAHLSAPEVVVEQILEPHSRDEQEVPRIALPALHGVFIGAVRRSAAVFRRGLFCQRPGLVELLEQVVQLQPLGPRERSVVFQQRQRHHEVREALPARCVGNVRHVLGQLHRVQEPRNGRPFLRLFVDHQRRAHTAVRVATARQRAPLRFPALDHVRETRKRADE